MKKSSTFDFLGNGNILCADMQITYYILSTKDFWLTLCPMVSRDTHITITIYATYFSYIIGNYRIIANYISYSINCDI